jgi:hypothetical protein
MSEDNKIVEDKPTISNFSAMGTFSEIEDINHVSIYLDVGIYATIEEKMGFRFFEKFRDLFPSLYISVTHGAVEQVICTYLDSNLNLQQW